MPEGNADLKAARHSAEYARSWLSDVVHYDRSRHIALPKAEWELKKALRLVQERMKNERIDSIKEGINE